MRRHNRSLFQADPSLGWFDGRAEKKIGHAAQSLGNIVLVDDDRREVGAGLMDGFDVFCVVLCMVFMVDTLKIDDQFFT